MRLVGSIVSAASLCFLIDLMTASFTAATNKEGDVTAIEYVAWDAAKMTATIEEVVLPKHQDEAKKTVDVMFLHTPKTNPETAYKDEWIYYRDVKGQHWKARCRLHVSPASISFQIFRWDQDNVEREDHSLKFVDWEELEWELTARIEAPRTPAGPSRPILHLQRPQ